MAEVDFDGTGKNYVALSTVHPDRDGLVETVVIVRQGKRGLDVHTLWRDEPGYDVVWRVGPTTVHEWDDPKNRVHIPHQSLVVERLESASRQYYRRDGQFRYVQTSD